MYILLGSWWQWRCVLLVLTIYQGSWIVYGAQVTRPTQGIAPNVLPAITSKIANS